MKKDLMRRGGRRFSRKRRLEIIKEHLEEGKRVSDICMDHGIEPARFYEWERKYLENLSNDRGDHASRKKRTFPGELDKD